MFGNADEKIEKLVRGDTPLPDGMQQLLRLCAREVPSPAWKRFQSLDYAADAQAMTEWLSKLLTAEPPPAKVSGLWFGLFNPVLEDGKATCCLYLAGSTRFNPKVPKLDCFSGPDYFPGGRYSDSLVLTTIYRTLQRFRKASGQGEYTLCWGYACLLVRDWCRGKLRKKLLGRARVRSLAVGFDSGDGLVVTTLRSRTR